jgi:WD40 repeat protein
VNRLIFIVLIALATQLRAQELVVQLGHTSPIVFLEVSPDGKFILSGSADGIVKLWDFHLGRLIRTYSKRVRGDDAAKAFFIETANSLKIPLQPEPDFANNEIKTNQFTLTMNYDSQAGEVTDIRTKKKKTFTAPPSALEAGETTAIQSLSVDAALNFMATGHGNINVFITSEKSDTTIKIIDLNTNQVVKTLPGHRGRSNKVRFTPNNNFIVSGGHDRLVKVWDVKTGFLVNTLGNVADAVMDVDFSSDGKTFATASDNPRTWNLATASMTQFFQGHRDLVSSVVFANDSQLITSSFDKTLKKWDLATGTMSKNFRGHTNRITEISLSGSGKYVASITSSGPELDAVSFNMSSFDKKHSAKIWDPLTGRSLKTLQGRSSVAISPDEKYIACPAGGFDEQDGIENTKGFKIELFTMPNGESLGSWPSNGSPAVLAFSPDSKLLAEGSNGVRVWKMENGSPTLLYDWSLKEQANTKLQADAWYWVTAIAFSKNSNQLAVAENANIKLYDLGTGKIIQILTGHFDDVRSLAFSPDAKFLLSGSIDTQLKVWNLQTGKEAASFISLKGSREFVVYTPDGYYMASKGGTQALHFVKGTRVYLFDQFDLQFNRPDIVLERIGLASKDLIDSYRKAYEKRIKKLGFNPENFEKERSFNVPELGLKNIPDYNTSTNANSFDITLDATDQLFLLDRLNVYVNGVPVHGIQGLNLKIKNTKVVSEKINLTLSQGRNIIELSVLNEKGVESLKERFELNCTQSGYKPVLHLVAISVSEYTNTNMNLKYAAKDGYDVISLFQDKIKEEGTFSRVAAHPLFNRDATKENILKLKAELHKTNVDDIVLIFVSGHGLLDKNLDYFLATHNVDFSNPSQNGLKYDDLESLLDGISARKKILMMDACHSGEIDKDEVEVTTIKNPKEGLKFRNFGNQTITSKSLGLNNSFELSKQLFNDLRKGSGTTVLSAASGVEVALEGDKWQNGVFTYCLLTGLKEKKADLNGDGQVMLSELQNYLFKEVSNVTEGKQQPTSRIENLIIDWRIW